MQGAGLVQDLLGNGQLADIMELGRVAKLGTVPVRQAHPLPDRFGKAGHGGVAFGQLGVAFGEGAQQHIAALASGERRALVFWVYMRWSTRRMASTTSWLSWGSRIDP
jgi:hypothetical protein